MKFHKIAPLAVLISLGAAALPAAAGESYVENSYRVKSIFNGHSTTNVRVKEQYDARTWAGSVSTKEVEATTTTSGDKDGVWFKEVDNSKIKTVSSATEDGKLSRTTNVTQRDSYDYSGINKDHRVTGGFSF